MYICIYVYMYVYIICIYLIEGCLPPANTPRDQPL